MKPSRSHRPLERSALTLGFVPLTDCAPLIAAQSAGFFAEEGLTVTLSREASWAAIRDKVAFGLLDGAQMLAGMPIAATLGVGAPPQAMVTALSLGLNGNAITVSEALYGRLVAADPEAMSERPCTARALKRVIDADREAGLAPMTFAMVHPASAHNYQLRYWLAAAGIDPDRDVRLIVVPPPRMVANLEAGRIAGYCVGEPWNQMAVRAGLGRVLITGYEIWRNAPEKVLGVTRDWAERHPNTHRALVRALVRAARWLDEPANRRGIVTRLAAPDRLDAPAEAIRGPLVGEFRHAREATSVSLPDFNVFHRYAANFPWCSQAMWFITQMLRWGQIGGALDIAATAAAVYRPGIYREAVADIGVAVRYGHPVEPACRSGRWRPTTAPSPWGPIASSTGASSIPPTVSAISPRPSRPRARRGSPNSHRSIPRTAHPSPARRSSWNSPTRPPASACSTSSRSRCAPST